MLCLKLNFCQAILCIVGNPDPVGSGKLSWISNFFQDPDPKLFVSYPDPCKPEKAEIIKIVPTSFFAFCFRLTQNTVECSFKVIKLVYSSFLLIDYN